MMPSSVHLRRALASDLDAILALERVTEHAPHWPRASYEDILESVGPPRCLIVAVADEVLMGFAVGLMHPAWHDCDAVSTAELESVVVAADSRRAGTGRALCGAILNWCRSEGATETFLEVRAASAGAIALYVRLGFAETGRRLRYYGDPEDDAVIMRVGLGAPDFPEEKK